MAVIAKGSSDNFTSPIHLTIPETVILSLMGTITRSPILNLLSLVLVIVNGVVYSLRGIDTSLYAVEENILALLGVLKEGTIKVIEKNIIQI